MPTSRLTPPWLWVQEYQDVWFGNPALDPALFTSCYAVQLDGFVQITPPTIQVCDILKLSAQNAACFS